jgi:hypothetical protein
MANRKVIELGVVCGLFLGFFWSIGPAGAAPPGLEDSITAVDAAMGPSGAARAEWKVFAAISSGNLTVFPVTATAWSGTSDFITLDEGLRSGKVVVTELGAGQESRGRQSRDRAEVNTLSLTNKSGRTLILLAGEMLIGGKQDRIVDRDQLVPPDDFPMALNVFCVEHGRWQGASRAFGQNQTEHSPQVPGARNLFGSGGGGSAGQIATPAVREKAEAGKDQNEVWSKVAETTRVLKATSSTGALTRAYDDGSIARQTKVYESQIKYRVQGNTVVGVVVAVNGRPVAADIFASPSLFQRYWPKLLKSYVLEALSSRGIKSGAIDRAAAESFLYRRDGNSSSEGKNDIYRLTERKAGGESSFELEYLAAAHPILIHFNRIASS